MTAPDVSADARARFELSMRRHHNRWNKGDWFFDRNSDGTYFHESVQCAWQGYRAAHADLSGEVRGLVEAAQALAAIVRKQCGGYLSGPGFDALNAAIELDSALAKFNQEKP